MVAIRTPWITLKVLERVVGPSSFFRRGSHLNGVGFFPKAPCNTKNSLERSLLTFIKTEPDTSRLLVSDALEGMASASLPLLFLCPKSPRSQPPT